MHFRFIKNLGPLWSRNGGGPRRKQRTLLANPEVQDGSRNPVWERRTKHGNRSLLSALEQGETRMFSVRSGASQATSMALTPRGSGNRALRQGAALGKELTQKERNIHLALAVERSRRRTHNKVTVLIGLDPVRELRELRISQNLAPASQVEPGLRRKVR